MVKNQQGQSVRAGKTTLAKGVVKKPATVMHTCSFYLGKEFCYLVNAHAHPVGFRLFIYLEYPSYFSLGDILVVYSLPGEIHLYLLL